ncbi:uncharacterized protein LOC116916514 isoform X1 [Daphnia magna]|uniref:uncharacterized protein LOC116916514 isoform X1 n=1 Tax=Daphnia magna TaxID=35525 RepID=UPI001E1BC2C5|nr:uncharacterized protein LOC116916514 isoform X1 [Daphnia magna]
MRRGLFLGGQLVIYSLLIVANESKRIEIQETNQDDRLRLRKHSCVSSRAGHLGALPGLFVDQDGIDGCNHDHGPAPSFSAPENGSTVKGHHGAPAQLHCTVQELHHRAVSWMKKTEDNLQLLTVGESSHTADPRISPDFTYPHLWQLKFNPAMINDSGTYLCHISTDPPLIRHIRLEISVPEPIVEIVDSLTDAALSSDRVLYYRIGSSLELRCRVKRYWIKPTRFHWLKSGNPVSDELWRGGISIYTEITKPGQLENKLSIANATINDGGNYTCSLDSFSVSIVVHFLKEEKQAASQHASNGGHSSVMENAFHQGMACHLILSFLLQVGISHRH